MLRYFLYVRKSLDRSDRQVMSIKGQINAIKELARRQGYNIVAVFEEEKSAKKPGRPAFNEMIDRLNKGEANGLLCWKLNRVARNPVDAGTIAWMLQCNIIQAIHSIEKSYLPTDNVLMMQIDFGIANQYVKDLSGDVKRGLRDKAELGWCPQSVLPIGYKHHEKTQNAQQQILIDRVRYLIVKEMWKLMETGAYSVSEIKRIGDNLGLVNHKGKPYALSTIHLVFQNPMYYGKFYWKDENGNMVLWKGKHKPMISFETFRKVQEIITARNRKIAPKKHYFTYRGLITCGGCNGHVCAERKYQAICANCKHKYSIVTNTECKKCGTDLSNMKNPSIIDKIYYRCTRRKDPSCREKSISETCIEERIFSLLDSVNIEEEMYDWLTKSIRKRVESTSSNSLVYLKSLEKQKARAQVKLKNLIDLRVSGEITKEQSDLLKKEYQEAIDQIEDDINKKEHGMNSTLHENQEYLDFSKNCLRRFKNGNQKDKKTITAFFCSNLSLKDKSLYFSTKKAPSLLQSLTSPVFSKNICSNVK